MKCVWYQISTGMYLTAGFTSLLWEVFIISLCFYLMYYSISYFPYREFSLEHQHLLRCDWGKYWNSSRVVIEKVKNNIDGGFLDLSVGISSWYTRCTRISLVINLLQLDCIFITSFSPRCLLISNAKQNHAN